MNKLNRWIRSKNGIYAIAGLLLLVVIVAVLLRVAGGPGTAGLPTVPLAEYDVPDGGYTCLPSCKEDDGLWLSFVSAGIASFGGNTTTVWIAVPGNLPSLELGFFDGDSGKDNQGNLVNYKSGNWDGTTGETIYTLYADPMKDGAGQQVLQTWHGNQDNMPNNAWFTATLPNDPAAKAPSGHYFYRLEMTAALEPMGINRAKLRSNGYLSTGEAYRDDTGFAIIGGFQNANDFQILSNPDGSSKYTGIWQFYTFVSADATYLEIWDGDFDRGTTEAVDADTDDPNSTGIPPWAGSFTVAERAGKKGAPADDSPNSSIRRSPAVLYKLIDPAGSPLYTNEEPSGTEEWEVFSMSTDPNSGADLVVDRIQPGLYTLQIEGLDSHNTVWIKLAVCDAEDGCGPCVWPGCDNSACPRTIGYWKNNVKKVLIDGKTNGVQESPETLNWALENIAKASPLYRTGINITAPAPIAGPGARLTDQEAYTILMRGASGAEYPGDKNTMLARALQQNLATWLNLASGKISDNTVIALSRDEGATFIFQGTVWEALQEAQAIMLNPNASAAELERAKDIGDLINNGMLGEDAAGSSCDDYVEQIPPDKQPPKHKDMPKGPKPEVPPSVPPEENTCTVYDTSLGGGHAIIALNPEACLGEQNGLLFHGTSSTTLDGTAFSNGCLRSVGTHTVTSSGVYWIADQFGDMSLITPEPTQASTPIDVQIAEPNCSDPAAHQMDGKDFKGAMSLDPGLYCITGDVTINAGDTLIGSDVTLYFIDGGLHINGNALVQLSAPAAAANASPALPNILIFLPASNPQPVQINGNSDSYFMGVIYAPKSEIEVLGTAQVLGLNMAQFIGWDVRVGGTADIWLGWTSGGLPVCTAP